MIRYFPAFQDDEILYSGVCKYHQQTLSNVDQTCVELFGNKHSNIHQLVTQNLDYFIDQVGDIINLTTEQAINSLTLIPLYLHFLEKSEFDSLKVAMTSPKSAFKLSIRLASKPYHLKFCPECIEADIKSGNELYWRRSQQIPFIPICPIHDCLLNVWKPGYEKINKRKSFYPASKVLRGKYETVKNEDSNLKRDVQILMKLLDNREDQKINLTILTRAEQVGFCKRTSFGKYFSREQVNSFMKYSNELITSQKISHDVIKLWLHGLFGSRGTSVINPLLCIQLNSFLQEKPLIKPLGQKTFECRNIFCHAYKKRIIRNYDSIKLGNRKKFCSYKVCCNDCDMIYYIRDVDNSKVWIHSYGTKFADGIHALSKSGYSIRKICDHTKVNRRTLTRIIKNRT